MKFIVIELKRLYQINLKRTSELIPQINGREVGVVLQNNSLQHICRFFRGQNQYWVCHGGKNMTQLVKCFKFTQIHVTSVIKIYQNKTKIMRISHVTVCILRQ